MALTFRPANPADTEAVVHVYLSSRKQFVSFAPLIHSDHEVLEWVRDFLIPSGQVTVATMDGNVIGMMALSKQGGVGWIDHMYVHPLAVGRGVGSS